MRRFLFLVFVPMVVWSQAKVPTNWYANLDTISVQIIRPADVTTYAASDVVCGADTAFLVFSNVARSPGASGYIVQAGLFADTANVAAATFRLHLFRDTTAGAGPALTRIGDNAQFTYLAGYRWKYGGYIDFSLSTSGTGSTAAFSMIQGINIPFLTIAPRNKLYGVLTTTSAYVPGNAGKLYIKLWVWKD
jgi:hypothetical protein